MKITGIYRIINIITNDIYVGSAARGINLRWNQHKSDLKLNKHGNIHLQRAYNKYGVENFIFEIIEKCESIKCIEREQYYIDTLKPRYNIDLKAGSPLGRKITPEQCLEISKRNKGRIAWNKGTPFNEETRKKMSESRKAGIKNGTIKLHTGLKLPRNKPILRNDGKIYPNVMTAALDLNVKENTVIKACTDKNQIRRIKGFILKYI